MSDPVVLAGGFGVPPATLRPLARALHRQGFDVHPAPLGWSVDCGERAVERLLTLVDDLAGDGPVAIVGHSRGGQLARVAAVRRPSTVRTLVTVVTPWSLGPPDRPGVALVAAGMRRLRQRGIDLVPSLECATADCCVTYRSDLTATPAARWTALWSSRDRVAGRDGRPPAAADQSDDLRTSHLGAVRQPDALDRIAVALGAARG